MAIILTPQNLLSTAALLCSADVVLFIKPDSIHLLCDPESYTRLVPLVRLCHPIFSWPCAEKSCPLIGARACACACACAVRHD